MKKLLVMALLLAMPRVARAEDPWAVGVTDAQKGAAQKELDAGNALFLQKRYAEALEAYRRAISYWDHPAIRFNVVRCLVQLDRPTEASENLEKALAYGAAPLEDSVYVDALAYQKLIANQVGSVEVHCDQPGVKITFDGKALPACPGTVTQRAAPGARPLVAIKDEYLPKTTDVNVIGGQTVKVEVTLTPLEHAGVVVHRYPGWVPWVVIGGGLAVAGVGGVIEATAASKFDAYDENTNNLCPMGCTSDMDIYGELQDQKHSAERWNTAGVATMVAGGAIAVSGAVLLYLNRGRIVYPTVEANPAGATAGFGARF